MTTEKLSAQLQDDALKNLEVMTSGIANQLEYEHGKHLEFRKGMFAAREQHYRLKNSQAFRIASIIEETIGKRRFPVSLIILLWKLMEFSWENLRKRNTGTHIDSAQKRVPTVDTDVFTRAQAALAEGMLSESFGLTKSWIPVNNTQKIWLTKMRSWHNLFANGFDLSTAQTLHPHCRPNCVGNVLNADIANEVVGYTVRSHQMMKVMRDTSWDVTPVVRLGYPTDKSRDPLKSPLTYSTDDIATVDDISYHHLQCFGVGKDNLTIEEYLIAYSNALIRKSLQLKLGLLHSASNFINGFAAIRAARALQIPCIYEVRGFWEMTRAVRQPRFSGSDLYRLNHKLEIECCLLSDSVITISKPLADYLISQGVQGEKIVVIPNCVDTEQFSSVAKDLDLAACLGMNPNTITIGFIGSVEEYEGLDDLIEAISAIREQYKVSYQILIVGEGNSLGKIKRIVEENELSPVFYSTGRVPHSAIKEYYSLCDIAVYPRRSHQVTELVPPLKPLEAMAMGIPIIVSKTKALAEIVTESDGGLIFEPGQVNQLAQCIFQLAQSNTLRLKLGRNGINWVSRKRSWSETVRPLLDRIYTDTQNSKQRR